MSTHLADMIVVVLICATVPAATLFPIVYGLTSPWWKSATGRALMVKSLATMLLIDFALAVRVLGLGPNDAALIRVGIMALIFAGVNLMFSAMLLARWRSRHGSTLGPLGISSTVDAD